MAVKSKAVLESEKNATLASGSNITAAEHRALLADIIDSYEDFIGSYTTAGMALIASPTLRQIIFNTDLDKYYYYDGADWQLLSSLWDVGGVESALMDKRSTTCDGENGTAIGTGAVNSNAHGQAFGRNAKNENGNGGQALGNDSYNRISDSTNISGAIIIRKDNGEVASDAYKLYAGAEVIILSKETDLKSTGTTTITIPTGVKFFVDEVGIICTQYSSVNTQPTVSYGKTGSNAYLKAAAITTDITAVGSRERETSLLTAEGLASLTAEVTIAATGTTLQGRFYFKGFIVENE